jgi:hypothetical protein
MQVKNRSRLKSIIIDILGVLMITAAALTGWLPGPGGIPLLIIGLSLLATNHEWAERWLNKVKRSGNKISDAIFNGSHITKWIIDILGILFVAAAVLILNHFTANAARSAAISLVALSLVLLLGNRNRLSELKKRLRK